MILINSNWILLNVHLVKYISKQIKQAAGMEVGVVSGLWGCVGFC